MKDMGLVSLNAGKQSHNTVFWTGGCEEVWKKGQADEKCDGWQHILDFKQHRRLPQYILYLTMV